ncbi:MAG: NAD-dependent epimerase/dehydratase family protein, partial [Asgard group archaeon]|nr:NAD-dependent epimerase/dehydratase family protein [Asgard group archaeon]
LSDKDLITKTIKTNAIDYVFHIAANISVTANYEEMYHTNVIGTKNMLEAFSDGNAAVFIYASTIGVYDNFLKEKRKYVVDENSKIGPLDGEPYPITKRLAEGLVFYYAETKKDCSFIITRLSPIVGPGDWQTIPSMVKAFSRRFIPKLIDQGKDLFCVTAPLDVARAQVFLAENAEKHSGEAFNIAQEPISYKEIFKVIADYYGRPHPRFSIPYWLFKAIIPFVRFLHKLFPKMELLKIALSPTCLNYLGKSYIYKSDKLKSLGFEFSVSPRAAIMDCLKHFDPHRELVKPGKNIDKTIRKDTSITLSQS